MRNTRNRAVDKIYVTILVTCLRITSVVFTQDSNPIKVLVDIGRTIKCVLDPIAPLVQKHLDVTCLFRLLKVPKCEEGTCMV